MARATLTLLALLTALALCECRGTEGSQAVGERVRQADLAVGRVKREAARVRRNRRRKTRKGSKRKIKVRKNGNKKSQQNKPKQFTKKPKQFKNIPKKARKKPGKKRFIKKSLSRNTTATCSGESLGDDCLANLIIALTFERDRVTNFMNQKERAENWKKIINGKNGKNTNFENTTTYLLLALGGNSSSLNCSKKASLTAEATETYQTLANCSSSVVTECKVPDDKGNFTELETCKKTYKEIQDKNKKCLEIKNDGKKVCECWKEAAEKTTEAKRQNKKCDAKTKMDDIKKMKASCISTFGKCKKAEDASVSYVMSCPNTA